MPSPSAATLAAIAAARSAMPSTVAHLSDLVRIPSCSFPGFDADHLERSAEATATWLRAAGYPQVRVERRAGIPPYVLAFDRRAGPAAPTLLLYAHHDVQPPLRLGRWTSPPHEPTVRDGRLYGRGAADDKAGIAAHAAAAAAWNATAGRPPINLAVLIEGEEEVGSPHFAEVLDLHADELAADAMVIADLANIAPGQPSLTTSLRGHVSLEVELKALRSPLHSGMWGGPLPDVVMALCRLLSTCCDAQGAITVPGIGDGLPPLTAAERADLARVPFDRSGFAAQAGLLRPEAWPLGDGVAVHAALWRRPTLAINAIQAGERGRTGNVLMDAAWARIGIRTVPGMDGEAVRERLIGHLRAHSPPWAELTFASDRAGEAWGTPTDHPLFVRAREALALGYGVEPVEIGCGASIPFVGQASARLGGIPAILIGVEDPACAAHAEDESVHLGDLASAIAAETALIGLLADG